MSEIREKNIEDQSGEPIEIKSDNPKPKEFVFREEEKQADLGPQIEKIKKEAGVFLPEKRATKKVIEESLPYDIEHVFIKVPGMEAENVTNLEKSKKGRFEADHAKTEKYSGADKITYLHTHPSETEGLNLTGKLFLWAVHGVGPKKYKNIDAISGLHSGKDIRGFLYLENEKVPSAPVAVRDPKTGKVLGYNVLKKTRETPQSLVSSQRGNVFQIFFAGLMARVGYDGISKDCRKYESTRIRSMRKGDPSSARKAYDELMKKYNLKSRLVSAEGYRVNETETGFEKQE